MMEYQFTAVYERNPAEESGGFLVYIEEMPGAISEGDTLEAARENIKDALKLIIEANREHTNEGHEDESRIVRETISLPANLSSEN